MKIDNQKVVFITYTLKQSDKEGEVIQEVQDNEPFQFVFGSGSLLPEFENNLKGKVEGDTFEFSLSSADSYGDPDPAAVVDLSIDMFMDNGKLVDIVQVGNFIPMNDQEGKPLQGLVLEISDDKVKMDFNHPLAGVDLFFTGKVISVNDAPKEELAAES